MSTQPVPPVARVDRLNHLRRAVGVLELLDESYRAGVRGDREEFSRAAWAAVDLSVNVVAAVNDGKVPHPRVDYDAWLKYLTTAREELRRAEAVALRPPADE